MYGQYSFLLFNQNPSLKLLGHFFLSRVTDFDCCVHHPETYFLSVLLAALFALLRSFSGICKVVLEAILFSNVLRIWELADAI